MYEAYYGALHYYTPAASFVATAIISLGINPVLGAVAGIPFAYSAWLNLQEVSRKGIFNPNKLSKLEGLIDFEQARRIFVAKGIEQIAQGMIQANPSEDKGTIVALYPRAHGMRIANMLEHPRPIKDTLLRSLYRMAPGLEYAVRKYDYQTDPDDPMLSNWRLVDRTKIKLLSRRQRLQHT